MTPCAASRTQTCARTFSKDFTVRSSGVSLRVFHRRTRWCKPSQQHAHTRKPSARPSRSRRTCLHCSALHSHTRTHPAHTCTPIRRARIFAVSCRRARCLRNPVVQARLRLLAWAVNAAPKLPFAWQNTCQGVVGQLRRPNMQRAEVDHVECRSHSDLLYNARGLKCATLAHALSLSQCLHKSSSDMSRAAAAVRPSLLTISAAKRNPKRPLHGALCVALTPERPSRVHCRKERRTENSRKLRDLL